MEECTTWQQNETLIIDFSLGVLFLLYFLLRLVGTENFLGFCFELNSVSAVLGELVQVVDVMTLPPLFLSIWLERTWLGLRFFRMLIWVNFPDILVYLRLLANSSSIRLAKVTTIPSPAPADLHDVGGHLLVVRGHLPPGEHGRPLGGVHAGGEVGGRQEHVQAPRVERLGLPVLRLVPHRDRLHGRLWRHLPLHRPRQDLHPLLPPW